MKAPKLTNLPMPYLIAGGTVLAALAWASIKGAKGAGAATASGTVDLANGLISEPVFIVGETLGIPRTEPTACEKAKAEGRTLDASFACPAVDFLKYVFN